MGLHCFFQIYLSEYLDFYVILIKVARKKITDETTGKEVLTK